MDKRGVINWNFSHEMQGPEQLQGLLSAFSVFLRATYLGEDSEMRSPPYNVVVMHATFRVKLAPVTASVVSSMRK